MDDYDLVTPVSLLRIDAPGLVDRQAQAWVSATATMKVRADPADPTARAELSLSLYYRLFTLGAQKGVPMPDAEDRVLITVEVEMKVPDAIPQPYAMLAVRVGVTGVGRASAFEEDRKRLMTRAVAGVQSDLAEIATLLRGRVPFTEADIAEARRRAAEG